MAVLLTDISFWNDDNETVTTVDFVKMKFAGIAGTIIRAGQKNWPDPDFAVNWKKAKEAGLPRGTYWFYDSRETPATQAERWVQMVGEDRPELGWWADYEETYGGTYTGWKSFKQFLSEVENRIGAELLGIYTGPSYWREHSPSNIQELNYFARHPLWIANYYVDKPDIPEPWISDILHQYTDKGNGPDVGTESLDVDMNRFNGTEEEFRLFFKLGDNGGNVEEPILYEGVVVWSGVNKRSAPSVNGAFLGMIAQGSPVQGVELKVITPNVEEWMRLPDNSWVAILYLGQKRIDYHRVDVHPAPMEITIILDDGSIWKARTFERLA